MVGARIHTTNRQVKSTRLATNLYLIGFRLFGWLPLRRFHMVEGKAS